MEKENWTHQDSCAIHADKDELPKSAAQVGKEEKPRSCTGWP